MVMFWRSWAERLTAQEKEQIEEISYGWVWLNFNTKKPGWEGTFYYFPRGSGYKQDSPPIPAEIAQQHKARFIGLEHGWLDEQTRTFTDLTAVTGMFPKEMEELYQRFKTEIHFGAKEHEEHVK